MCFHLFHSLLIPFFPVVAFYFPIPPLSSSFLFVFLSLAKDKHYCSRTAAALVVWKGCLSHSCICMWHIAGFRTAESSAFLSQLVTQKKHEWSLVNSWRGACCWGRQSGWDLEIMASSDNVAAEAGKVWDVYWLMDRNAKALITG